MLLRPDVVARGHASSIEVTGIRSRTLQVRLVGASANSGRPIPWTPLHLAHGIWHAKLEMPELRGIYPVELRVGPGARILRSDEWLLRVFAKGTFARPSFDTPEDVARWWVQNIPGGAKLVALKRWPRPAFDRRDPRLHRLLVLAYSPTGHPAVHDRLGIFVTACTAAVALYGLYELARGLVVGDTGEAEAHARTLVALERSLHVFVETNVQRSRATSDWR